MNGNLLSVVRDTIDRSELNECQRMKLLTSEIERVNEINPLNFGTNKPIFQRQKSIRVSINRWIPVAHYKSIDLRDSDKSSSTGSIHGDDCFQFLLFNRLNNSFFPKSMGNTMAMNAIPMQHINLYAYKFAITIAQFTTCSAHHALNGA